MRKIEISLTEDQYQQISSEIEKGSQINMEEGTLSGFSFKLCVVAPGISFMEMEMLNKIDIGDVDWKLK